MLQVGLQILACPWVQVLLLWRREVRSAPQLPLPGVPPCLPLLSPPPLTHTLTHTHTHSSNAVAAVLRGSPPFWRLAHTHMPQVHYVHSSCASRQKQPPPLSLTLHLHRQGIRHHQHVANTSLTHTSPRPQLISFCLSPKGCMRHSSLWHAA